MTKTRKRYDIKYHELNLNKALKESLFMLFLQDVATLNAEENGIGYDWLIPNHLGWFLLKYRMEFVRYPNNMDYIEIETMSRGAQKLFAMRDFYIYSPENELICTIASSWALMDMDNKTMVLPQKFKENIDVYQKSDNDLNFHKIILPSTFDYQKDFEVRFDDIDVNHHANNTTYISWALDALPCEFRRKYSIKNIDMYFKKEITLSEILTSKVKINSELNQTVHVLINKNTQDDLCNMCIDWQ